MKPVTIAALGFASAFIVNGTRKMHQAVQPRLIVYSDSKKKKGHQK